MMFNKFIKKGIILTIFSISIVGSAIFYDKNSKQASAITHYPVDVSTYYDGISGEGTSLLSALQSLNATKRKSTVGYSAMGTSPSGMFKYTDYDPNYTEVDDNGQIYGTKILSFYSGKSTTSWNREHVWPNSRGGGSVDSDIFMPRPTITAENSDRGNSSYITGMSHSSNGWDPVTSFADNIGVYQSIRGECARISFYCMVANPNLTIKEGADLSYKNSMGDLISLLEWHVDNPINPREVNRNNGGQYLQGNRNPFVDHPEYVCQIWGNTNDKTRSICSRDPYAQTSPTSITLNTSYTSIVEGFTQTLSVISVTPSGANKNVTWSSSDSGIAIVNTSGVVTAIKKGKAVITATSVADKSVKAACEVTVIEPQAIKLESISASLVTDEIFTDDKTQINISNYPSDAYPFPAYTYESNNTVVATVNALGEVQGISPGSATITITATQGNVVVSDQVVINVIQKQKVDGIITISRNSFTTKGGYGWYTWNSDDIVGQGYLYTTNAEKVQINNKSGNTGRFFNSDEMPGNISSIKISLNNSTTDEKEFKVKTSNKAFIQEGTSSGIIHDLGTFVTTKKVVTIDTSKNSDSYFWIEYASSGVCYIDSIDVEYSSGSSIPVNGITISEDSISLVKGETYQLSGHVLPINASNQNVEWLSTNTSSAVVSSSGLVTALAPGTGVIKIVSQEGEFTKSCSFDVVSKDLVSVTLDTAVDIPFAENPDVNNFTLIAHYNDGSEASVKPTQISFASGFDSYSLGKKEIIATFTQNGITKSCTFVSTVTNVGAKQKVTPGKETIYSYQFTKQVFDDSHTKNVSLGDLSFNSDIVWDLSSYFGYDTKGQQFGSEGLPASFICLKTINSLSKVKSVKITTSIEKDEYDHYLSVNVGNNSFDNTNFGRKTKVYINETSTEYIFEPQTGISSCDGIVSINYDLSTAQNKESVFIKKIEIAYTTADTVNWTSEEQAQATVNFIKDISSCYSIQYKFDLKQCIIEFNAMNLDSKKSSIWNESFVDEGGYSTSYLNKILTIAGQYNSHVAIDEQIELELPDSNTLGISLTDTTYISDDNTLFTFIIIVLVLTLTPLCFLVITKQKRKR